MGGFEFMMLVCFGFSWPFSILKSIRSRSTKGKSLVFMLLVLCGYIFGLIHKLLYSRDWVIWAYAAAMLLVVIDLLLYVRNWLGERALPGGPEDGRVASPRRPQMQMIGNAIQR